MCNFMKWLTTEPNDSDLFFVNIRESIQVVMSFFRELGAPYV